RRPDGFARRGRARAGLGKHPPAACRAVHPRGARRSRGRRDGRGENVVPGGPQRRLSADGRDDEMRPAPSSRTPGHMAPLEFVRRVLTGFRKSHGFLLASAVAYNALLSIVPLFAVLLALLSGLVDEQLLQRTISRWVEQLLP